MPSITIISITLSFLLLLAPPISSASSINVWPMPRNFSWPSPQANPVSPNFYIISPPHPHLSAAAKRYRNLILTEHHRPLVDPSPSVHVNTSAPALFTLTITVSDLAAPLQHGVDESYTLTIPIVGGAAYLTAQTAWGAMRGLETLSQLVWGETTSVVAVGIYVWDAPLFMHRGLMLDTSRNFYKVEDLLRTIETMGANKLNVFHWHITDSHSFPLAVPSEPGLASMGSYGSSMQYSADDVTKIVEFGLEHGVRVMPEIDSPG